MLHWAQQFNIFCFLDNQQFRHAPHQYDCLLAAGALSTLSGNYIDFKTNRNFFDEKAWAFGHLSYELLHPMYKLNAEKKSGIQFPPFAFFRPQHVLYIADNYLHIEAADPQAVFEQLQAWPFEKVAPQTAITIQQRFTKQEYLTRVQQLQQHILRGDCYEINFCQEFFAEATLSPLQVFQNLMQHSPAPFAAFYKWHDQYLMCASPERFLSRQNNTLFTQPIKGTTRRSSDAAEDVRLKQQLQNSLKEQTENVMIVDLMRNDLSKVCSPGSVKVDELFGVYTFPHVHQLISTISGEVDPNVSFTDIIEATFPMGSMTGAPKQRVLQLIDQYELVARGLFSGSVGYISPTGDFDFNVVIRSILYNQAARYVSLQAGSGITFYSDAEQEWQECLLKAQALKDALLQ